MAIFHGFMRDDSDSDDDYLWEFEDYDYASIDLTPNKTDQFGIIKGIDHDIQTSMLYELANSIETEFLEPSRVVTFLTSERPQGKSAYFSFYNIDTGIFSNLPGNKTMKTHFPGRKNKEVLHYIPDPERASQYKIKLRPCIRDLVDYCRTVLKEARNEVHDAAVKAQEPSDMPALQKRMVPVTKLFCMRLRQAANRIEKNYEDYKKAKRAIISGLFHGCRYSKWVRAPLEDWCEILT